MMDDNYNVRGPGETLNQLVLRPKYATNLIAAVDAIKQLLPESFGGAHEHLDDIRGDLERKTIQLSEARDRLRGFIHGLWGAGAIDVSDWHDLDNQLIEAAQ